MKIKVSLVAIVLGVLFSANALFAQSLEASQPHIVVTGKAEVAVEPDRATISVDFTKVDKQLNVARKANEEGVAKMLDVARKYNIPPEDVRTNNISVKMKYISTRDRQRPTYDEDGDEIGTRVFEGYEVSRSVTIVLKNLDRFDAIFNDILATQPTEIDRVAFESSKLIELREQAREMAMKAAHSKAKAMTTAIGQTVGKAIRISEGTSADRFSALPNGMANALNVVSSGGSTTSTANLATFSAGTITIEASVTVVFFLN